MDELESLIHSVWDCKYHVVFIPKYRRKKLYGQLRRDLREVFRKLASQKESRILEGHLMPDHVHMLIAIVGYTRLGGPRARGATGPGSSAGAPPRLHARTLARSDERSPRARERERPSARRTTYGARRRARARARGSWGRGS